MQAKLGPVLLGMILLAGCGARTSAVSRHTAIPTTTRSPAAHSPPRSVACPRDLFARRAHVREPHGRLPRGFRTVWVLRCRDGTERRPGRGEWGTVLTQRADTNAAALVAALRRPAPRPAGICASVFIATPYFALVDADGRAIRPTVAMDRCGHPSSRVLTALAALPFRTIAVHPVRQTRTELELTTGCPAGYKDMIAFEDAYHHPGPAGPLWPRPARRLQICLFGHVRPGNIPVGYLTSARIIHGPAAHRLVTTLDTAGPARPCDAPHTRFALVALARGEPSGVALVELDGCHRMLRPDGHTLAQLDPTTVRRIARLGGT